MRLKFLWKNGKIFWWSQSTTQIPLGTEEFNSLWNPSEMPALFQRNSGHPAVLTSGETGEITVGFHKKFSEIPGRFRWNSIRISESIHHRIYWDTAEIPLENSDKFPGGIQLEFRWPSGGVPVELRRNTTGIPLDYLNQRRNRQDSSGFST